MWLFSLCGVPLDVNPFGGPSLMRRGLVPTRSPRATVVLSKDAVRVWVSGTTCVVPKSAIVGAEYRFQNGFTVLRGYDDVLLLKVGESVPLVVPGSAHGFSELLHWLDVNALTTRTEVE